MTVPDPTTDHVTASPGAIYGVVTAHKRHRCDGHLAVDPHHIEPGERYVASALPPNDPDIGNDRWWHARFCRDCCPAEYIEVVSDDRP